MVDVARLVERAKQGDRDAFGELVRRYRGFVFSLCFQRTGDWDDSEDLTQEVFVTAHRSLSSMREPAKLAAWLRGVAENVCKMHWRRQRPQGAPTEAEEAGSEEWARTARRLELQSILHRALDDIPEASRDVISQHYLGGYSYAEIADLCGLAEKTVRSRLHEGRHQLKARLLQTVAELCECSQDPGHTVRCVLERCGSDPCECADRLREE